MENPKLRTNSNRFKHGWSSSATYRAHRKMLERCYNPNFLNFEFWGGKGIKVCDRWQGERGFENFLEDMEPRPSPAHSLDRIDNDKDYTPENCRWATKEQQMRNRSNTVFLDHRGFRKPLVEWVEELGLTVAALEHRLKRGWSVDEALTTPVRGTVRKNNAGSYKRSKG